VEKAAETTFVQKTRAYNVDEIDGRLCEQTGQARIQPPPTS